MSEELEAAISTIAPVLASALSTPLAGIATSLLSQALLGKTKALPEDLIKSLNYPDSLIKVQQAENQFILELQKVGLDRDRLAEMDTRNARQRDIDLAKLGNPDVLLKNAAYMIIAGFFLIAALIIVFPFHPDKQQIINYLLGNLTGAFMTIVAFLYGSSVGSRIKDFIIGKGASKP